MSAPVKVDELTEPTGVIVMIMAAALTDQQKKKKRRRGEEEEKASVSLGATCMSLCVFLRVRGFLHLIHPQ